MKIFRYLVAFTWEDVRGSLHVANDVVDWKDFKPIDSREGVDDVASLYEGKNGMRNIIIVNLVLLGEV